MILVESEACSHHTNYYIIASTSLQVPIASDELIQKKSCFTHTLVTYLLFDDESVSTSSLPSSDSTSYTSSGTTISSLIEWQPVGCYWHCLVEVKTCHPMACFVT